MNNQERLKAFELAWQEINHEYDKCEAELTDLKKLGQMKKVKFRETLGRKLIYARIISSFAKYGIKKEDE